jgi:hypothetical protein
MKLSTLHFAVAYLPGAVDEVACFSLDSARPDDYIESLERELKKIRFKGNVLLDLLASNGDTRRRFMRASFDGKKMDWLSAKIVSRESLAPATLQFCQRFYCEHASELQNSVLSKAAKYRISSGDYAASYV